MIASSVPDVIIFARTAGCDLGNPDSFASRRGRLLYDLLRKQELLTSQVADVENLLITKWRHVSRRKWRRINNLMVELPQRKLNIINKLLMSVDVKKIRGSLSSEEKEEWGLD